MVLKLKDEFYRATKKPLVLAGLYGLHFTRYVLIALNLLPPAAQNTGCLLGWCFTKMAFEAYKDKVQRCHKQEGREGEMGEGGPRERAKRRGQMKDD